MLLQAHKKVLDKHGKPDDVPAGIKGSKMALPQTPLTGMYNKYGGKTRLTFKLDSDEVWIGTKGNTYSSALWKTNEEYTKVKIKEGRKVWLEYKLTQSP